ncbi:hypothetical protein [Risungbinella massiliensis]|nr:hypothetical protein [Risungbinella massiliensis]
MVGVVFESVGIGLGTDSEDTSWQPVSQTKQLIQIKEDTIDLILD